MCLPISRKVVPPEGTALAWKAFDRTSDVDSLKRGLFWPFFNWNGQERVPTGKWMTAEAIGGKRSPVGFHVFRTLEGAKTWAGSAGSHVLVRVRIRGFKRGCRFQGHDAYRVQELFVPKRGQRIYRW